MSIRLAYRQAFIGVVASLGVLFLVPTAVWAQEANEAAESAPAEAATDEASSAEEGASQSYASAEPTPEQVKLNASAVEAIVAEDYGKAVSLLEASIELGALNVSWLNLGRAYQKLGKCAKARQAYLSVPSSPAVDDPPYRLVNAKADQYLAELDEMCGQDPGVSEASEKAALDPGKSDELAEPMPPPDGPNTGGWLLTAGGGLLLAGGGVFYYLAQDQYQPLRDAVDGQANSDSAIPTDTMTRSEAVDRQARGDMYSTLALSTAAAGVAATSVGVVLLLSDSGNETPRVGVGASPDGWTVGVSGRF